MRPSISFESSFFLIKKKKKFGAKKSTWAKANLSSFFLQILEKKKKKKSFQSTSYQEKRSRKTKTHPTFPSILRPSPRHRDDEKGLDFGFLTVLQGNFILFYFFSGFRDQWSWSVERRKALLL